MGYKAGGDNVHAPAQIQQLIWLRFVVWCMDVCTCSCAHANAAHMGWGWHITPLHHAWKQNSIMQLLVRTSLH